MINRWSGFLYLAWIVTAIQPIAHGEQVQFQLVDWTAESGVDFIHTDGGCGRHYIVETVSAGLALFDYNNDGHVDLYFLNGAPLPGYELKDTPPMNRLYRNNGGWSFTDVTLEAGVGDLGYGLGVAVGDYNGDGNQDLYLNNFGPNVLMKNNGDGTFSDVTEAAGVRNGSRVGAGACFFDMDADDDLDLYVANYLDFSFDKHIEQTFEGVPAYVNPRRYSPVPDTLYRNNGDGTFTDVSKESGIGLHAGWGMGIVCCDFDNDRDTDVFIGNDVAENFLFENDGNGRFEEIGLLTGVAFDMHGDEQGSMGVDTGDYDNDGLFDFYVTSYQRQLATLYRNLGNGFFEDVTIKTGAGIGTLSLVTWGNSFVDFDLDGDRDIFVACGHLQDTVEQYDDSTAYKAPNILFLNDGKGRFKALGEEAGSGMAIAESSRGAGFDDLDNDGDVDVVILNSRARATLLKNDTQKQHHWLQIRLRGNGGNLYAVGARVGVKTSTGVLWDEVHSGRGYQSHYGDRLYFGLGDASDVEWVRVIWPGADGRQEEFSIDQVDCEVILRFGQGKPLES